MDVAGFNSGIQLNLTAQGEAWRLTGSSVSANLFTVLGAGARLGRTFTLGEDQPEKDNLVILSYALWQDKFGGEAGVIGRVITLGGVDRQVVGVMPPGFAFPDAATQLWIPLRLDPRDPTAYWAKGFMPVIGRLRREAGLEQAQQEIRSLSRQMISLYPYPMGRDFNAEATVVPLQQFRVSQFRTRLIVLQCAVGLVLLIACANVANLLLSRGASRRKEMALRGALGAARGRILRQLLTESVVLGLAGGGLGLVLASGALWVLRLALPIPQSGTQASPDIAMDWHVLAFTGLLAVLTGLAFGLVPALSSSLVDLGESLKTGGRRLMGAVGGRARGALIAGEVALAVVLTVSAGLLVKSLWLLAQVNPGFQPEHLLTLRVSPNQSLCRARARCLALYDNLLQKTQEIPGVHEAAAANTLPLETHVSTFAVRVEGFPYVPAEHTAPLFWAGAVTPDYFRVMHIPILEGRAFTVSDGDASTPVVIVSAATARRYWPGENPIGKHVRPVWEETWRTVVGVAGDVRQFDLRGHSPENISGALYMPYAQSVDDSRQLPAAMTLIVRTPADPGAVSTSIRELVRGLNPNVPVSEIRTMESLISESTKQPSSMAWLFVSFAGVALLLAAVGTYGVISYSTAQRTFEIGVRVALGATRGEIFSLVLGQGLRLVLNGVALGVVASFALTRMLASFLYGTAVTDPATFAAVCGLLAAIALLAAYFPARRATKVDPTVALRHE